MIADPLIEAALVARLLLFPDSITTLTLSPDDFSSRDMRQAYSAMLELVSQHRAVDVATLRSMCPDVDFRQLLSEVSPAHRASPDEYAGQIADMAARRRLVGNLEGVIARAEYGNAESVIADLSSTVSQALAGSSGDGLVSPEQAITNYQRVIEQRTNHRVGLSWAPAALNSVLQPVQPGELVIVAARPSVGKTLLAEQLTEIWAQESGQPVLFVSLEMSTTKLLDRALTRAGHITRGVLNDDAAQRAREALATRRGVGIWYLDQPRATSADVRSAAAKIKMLGGGLGGIAVDHIGLLRDKNDNEIQRLGTISAEMKALALEHDIPVLVLSQLNRNSMRREDPTPRLDDLRESGRLEENCDICLGLHRVIGDDTLTVKILKNRDGEAGQVMHLKFEEERVRLS